MVEIGHSASFLRDRLAADGHVSGARRYPAPVLIFAAIIVDVCARITVHAQAMFVLNEERKNRLTMINKRLGGGRVNDFRLTSPVVVLAV